MLILSIARSQLHTIILINMGGVTDLRTELGEFPPGVAIHIIDSARPLDLTNVHSADNEGSRVIVWDDGHIEGLSEEKRAWEVITVSMASVSSYFPVLILTGLVRT